MAKKNQTTAKKKLKSDDSESDNILDEINAKRKSAQKDLQKQVDELTSQVKILSKDPAKTARKFLKAMEKSYHEKVAQLQKDFDKRMVAVHKLQDRVIAQLPTELAEKLHLKASSETEPAKPKTATKKAKPKTVTKAAPKAAPKTATKTAKPKTVTKAAPKAATKAVKTPTIASIVGIGPVTHKKLIDAGFTSLEDLANTPVSKIEALKQFEKTKGFTTWKKEAQALLNKKQ